MNPTLVKAISTNIANWFLAALLIGLSKIFDAFVPPFQRRFSLQDTSIGYPHAELETINNIVLWLLSLGLPALIVLLISVKERNFFETHQACLALFFSTAFAYIITHFTKNLVGRLRPDFLDRCQPKLNSDGTPEIPAVFGLNDVSICSQEDPKLLRGGMQSFFSGHTSTAFSGLGFLSLYLAYTFSLWKRPGNVFKTYLVLAPLILALFIGLSRVSDYRHHWEDVLVGAIVGLLSAFYCFRQFFPFSKPTMGRVSSFQESYLENTGLTPYRDGHLEPLPS